MFHGHCRKAVQCWKKLIFYFKEPLFLFLFSCIHVHILERKWALFPFCPVSQVYPIQRLNLPGRTDLLYLFLLNWRGEENLPWRWCWFPLAACRGCQGGSVTLDGLSRQASGFRLVLSLHSLVREVSAVSAFIYFPVAPIIVNKIVNSTCVRMRDFSLPSGSPQVEKPHVFI